MKTNNFYDYAQDLDFIARSESMGDCDAIAKLELMTAGRASKTMHVSHSSLKEKYLPFSDIQIMIEDPAAVFAHIREFETLPEGEQRQVRDEISEAIFEAIRKVYNQRCNGAKKRVSVYERNNPELAHHPLAGRLIELCSAVRSKNPDKVYNIAERIAIMTEDFPDNHPVVVEYRKVLSKAPVSQL